MAVLTLTIPDAQVNRLVTAVAQQRGKDVSGMTAPQKIQMMKDDVIVYWKGVVQASEVPAAEAAARAAKVADVETGLTVT